MYYILKGHDVVPVDDVMEWALWREANEKTLAATHVGPYWISTVFMGLDHGFGTAKPLVFESMVFQGPDSSDVEQLRYATWDEAMAGHIALVQRFKKMALLSPAWWRDRSAGS